MMKLTISVKVRHRGYESGDKVSVEMNCFIKSEENGFVGFDRFVRGSAFAGHEHRTHHRRQRRKEPAFGLSVLSLGGCGITSSQEQDMAVVVFLVIVVVIMMMVVP